MVFDCSCIDGTDPCPFSPAELIFFLSASALYLHTPNAITKVVPVLTLLMRVVFGSSKGDRRTKAMLNRYWYVALVAIGLILSGIGDIALSYQSLDGKYFIIGLAFFLLAHVSYIGAYFSAGASVSYSRGTLILMSGFFSVMMGLILPHLDQNESILRNAVIAYGLTISTMGLLALNKYLQDKSTWPAAITAKSSKIAVIGSVLFIISDTTLAIHKFRSPLPFADVIIMFTYYFGQGLIALSTLV